MGSHSARDMVLDFDAVLLALAFLTPIAYGGPFFNPHNTFHFSSVELCSIVFNSVLNPPVVFQQFQILSKRLGIL